MPENPLDAPTALAFIGISKKEKNSPNMAVTMFESIATPSPNATNAAITPGLVFLKRKVSFKDCFEIKKPKRQGIPAKNKE